MSLVGGTTMTIGIGFLVADPQSPPGATLTTLTTLGTVLSVGGPPVMLAGSMRANHALRKRGVYVSNTSGVVGWTTLGLGIVFSPALALAPQPAPPVYAGVVGLAGGQLHTNGRGCADAGFEPIRRMELGVAPSDHGLQLIGTF